MIYLSLSGGLDSTVLAGLEWHEPVVCIGFDYGQRHSRELNAAQSVADYYGYEYWTVALPELFSPALTGDTPVPHGHYEDKNMGLTVVQGRNLLFISTLVSLARPGDAVAIGVHAGDHAVYPDCRPQFIHPLRTAIRAAYDVDLVAPFLTKSKAEIVAQGRVRSAPMMLSWSCYEGGAEHCGKCGTCVERAEAFHLADTPDPTDYVDPDYWRTRVHDQ